MRGGIAAIVLMGGVASSGAWALSPPAQAKASRCTVVGDDKLTRSLGGSSAVCREIERAIAARAPGARYSAQIRVLSRSRLAAQLVVDGRSLPVQNFAVMDGNLNARAISHFADALATAVAEALKS